MPLRCGRALSLDSEWLFVPFISRRFSASTGPIGKPLFEWFCESVTSHLRQVSVEATSGCRYNDGGAFKVLALLLWRAQEFGRLQIGGSVREKVVDLISGVVYVPSGLEPTHFLFVKSPAFSFWKLE